MATNKTFTNKIIPFLLVTVMSLAPCSLVNASAEGTDGGIKVTEYQNKDVLMDDGIYFYDISTTGGNSDMILVGSNGRWGLIDTGHRYSTSIKDKDGNSHPTTSHGLSIQTEGKNGKDGMKYMIETLGVDHLDFIIGTHAHSDHIGGLPEIASITVVDKNGNEKPLVDDKTIYICKTYNSINTTNDVTWLNPAFAFQAREAIKAQKGSVVDISCGLLYKDGDLVKANETSNLNLIQNQGDFTDVKYTAGKSTYALDDNISFQWGDMKFTLYNLFGVQGVKKDSSGNKTAVTPGDENVNSIVTVIECNGRLICLAGDMNTEFTTEQKMSRILQKDFLNPQKGYARFDLVKMSHHGIAVGSNSKEWIDKTKPKLMVGTNLLSDMSEQSKVDVYAAAKYYAITKYNTAVYGVGASDRMLAFDIKKDKIGIYNMTGTGSKAELDDGSTCRDKGNVEDGWTRWAQEINYKTVNQWFYFSGNKAVKNKWIQDNTGWLYLNSNGLLTKDDIRKDSKGICYLDENGYALTVKNKWYFVKPKLSWYYFDSDGYALTNEWKKDSEGWCYLGSDGKLVKDDVADDSLGTCYLDKDGHALTVKSKWQFVGGQNAWYYFDADGYAVKSTWKKDSKEWCYLGGNGKLVRNSVVKGTLDGETQYWYVNNEGRRDLTYTGMATNNSGTWYCQNGIVTFKYNGTIKANGKAYTFKNSKLVKTVNL